jgi:hypothetical protein
MPLRHYFRHADITPLPLFEDYDACHYADCQIFAAAIDFHADSLMLPPSMFSLITLLHFDAAADC